MRIIRIDNTNKNHELSKINNRGQESSVDIDRVVDLILMDVKKGGDISLREQTLRLDGVAIADIRVSRTEIEQSMEAVETGFIDILREAFKNIWDYHLNQKQNSWFVNKKEGGMLGQLVNPIPRVGIYVPGGKAAYPSTVLMNAIPALIAGVNSIAMVTPPSKDGSINPYILAAANICGIKEIYRVGGAQAVAALAYGTESIKPVNKIVGPGNIYVARAKRMVFGQVDIDMIAGPSEICIIADGRANPKFIAADLLSQAEHDEEASSILITVSEDLAMEVSYEVERQLANLNRREIAKSSIANYGAIFIVRDIKEALELSNELAPEHLELMVENPLELIKDVKNAGAVFLGDYSPEPLGDYFAGPNHTLPTGGTAKFSSPLGVEDFIKKTSLIYYGYEDLKKVKDKIIGFAAREGLEAHGNSVKVRF